MAVVSAGPDANLHLAADRMPASHHSVVTGRMPFLPPNQHHQNTEGKITVFIAPKSKIMKAHCGAWYAVWKECFKMLVKRVMGLCPEIFKLLS